MATTLRKQKPPHALPPQSTKPEEIACQALRAILADVLAGLAKSQKKCDEIARGEFKTIVEAFDLAREARVAAGAASEYLATLEGFLGHDEPPF